MSTGLSRSRVLQWVTSSSPTLAPEERDKEMNGRGCGSFSWGSMWVVKTPSSIQSALSATYWFPPGLHFALEGTVLVTNELWKKRFFFFPKIAP